MFFFILWHKKHLYFFKKFKGKKMFLLIFFKYIFFFIKFLFNYKKVFYFKKNKFNFNFKKKHICFNCHGNLLNCTKKFFCPPIIKNQNWDYLKYSLYLYKNFKRNSIYMNMISNYLNNTDIFDISLFFKWY